MPSAVRDAALLGERHQVHEIGPVRGDGVVRVPALVSTCAR